MPDLYDDTYTWALTPLLGKLHSWQAALMAFWTERKRRALSVLSTLVFS